MIEKGGRIPDEMAIEDIYQFLMLAYNAYRQRERAVQFIDMREALTRFHCHALIDAEDDAGLTFDERRIQRQLACNAFEQEMLI